MATLGELVVRIGADARNFTRGLSDTTRQLTRWSRQAEESMGPAMDAIGGALKVIGTSAAVGFGGLVASGIKANSQMEQYRATLDTVMQDSAKAGETLDWVKQYAAKTPFEMPGLVEATVKLSAMGLEAQKFLPIAGDMAAVFASSGKDVGMAAEAINDAMMGEFERLKEFGIKLQATDFKSGGKYAGKTYAEALEAEFKAHNYAGAADALSKTFTGRMSTLKDTVGMFLQDATGPLFTALADKMGGLITKIEELQASGKLADWANQAKTAFEAAWQIIETVGNTLLNLGKGIYDNWNIISPVLAGVLSSYIAFGFATKIMAAVTFAMKAYGTATTWAAAEQGFLNAAMRANPIGLVVTAIGLLVAAGILLYKNWDTIKAKAIEVWGSLKGTVSGAIEGIKAYVSNMVQIGKDIVLGLWQGIQDMGQWLYDKVASFVKDNVVGTVKSFLGIASPSKAMAELGKCAAQGLAMGLGEGKDGVVTQTQLLADEVTRIKDRIFELNRQYEVTVALQGAASEAAAELRKQIAEQASAYDKLSASIGSAATSATSLWSQMSKVNTRSSGGKSKFEDIARAISLGQTMPTIKGGWEGNNQSAIDNWAGSFATGGIIPGPIGAPMIAQVHGGEEVIPVGGKSKNGGLKDIIINIYGSVGIDDIGEQLVRILRRQGVMA